MSDQTYKAHILVVDDSYEIQDFLKNAILEPQGYQVTTAWNGAQGLRAVQEQPPDLMLLDYEMPVMNGIEMLRVLHEQKIRLPSILITSYGSESVAVEVFRLGVRDYVPKPFTMDEILQAIQRVLYAVHLEQERDALFLKLQQVNAQLAQRIKELDTLYHVSKSVTTLQERDKLLERIVDAALYLTGALEGQLVLIDPSTGELLPHVQRESRGPGQTAPSPLQNIDTHAPGLMMNVPLKVGRNLVGALTVSNKRNRQPLNQQDQRLLRMLADYAAIAIENFRLLAEVENRREQEKRELRDRFAHFMAPPVVERILQRPQSVQPGGHRRSVAVLFADLRGFTAFGATAAPEALITVLNRHMAVAAEAITQEEGTLDKFVGDEVMALFNAPASLADYALHAVNAAWIIQQMLSKVHQTFPVHQRLLFGIGIATGEAVVGNVGTYSLVNFTAIGPTVSKAHALQELAPPGKILICQTTYEMVKPMVHVRTLSPIWIKGQLHPEPVYEVQNVQWRIPLPQPILYEELQTR